MSKKPTVGVILSGCGVYDGAEIHESVLTLLELDRAGASIRCFAPDMDQHHVVNHLNGTEMSEKRNVLIEAARIARGAIQPLSELNVNEIDALVLPGGFGAAKNFTQWAFKGPEGSILPELKNLIQEAVKVKKPIAALCMAPTTLAKAMEGSGISLQLTVGSTAAGSPYDIKAISEGMNNIGAKAEMKTVEEIAIDSTHHIVTSPCYMMDARISEIHTGIKKCIDALMGMINQ